MLPRVLVTSLVFMLGCSSEPTSTPPVLADATANTLDATDATMNTSDAQTVADTHAPDDAPRPDASVSGWRRDAPLPFARQEIAVGVARGRIYVLGGFESGRIVANVRVYDPATDAWTLGPELPSARHHVAVATLGDDLYALGGMTDLAFTPDSTCYVLRAGAASWQTIAPLPLPRGAGVAGGVGGRIVVTGGVGTRNTLLVQSAVYDPASDSWRTGAPPLTRREHLAAFVHGGRLWTVGGRLLSLSSNLAAVESYDPVTDTWRQEAAMPTARGGLGAAVLGDVAYVFGGEQPDRALDTVEAMDLTRGTWRTVAPIPTPRHGMGVAAAGGRIYVLGGADQPTFAAVPVVESYAP